MLHIGGLTFCHDAKQLQVPNLVAAERFGKAALDRLGLRLEDVNLAFQNIVSTGNIEQAFSLYQQTMSTRDVGESDYKKNEEHHRDSFYYALLGNSHPSLRKIGLEVQVTKVRRAEFLKDECATSPKVMVFFSTTYYRHLIYGYSYVSAGATAMAIQYRADRHADPCAIEKTHTTPGVEGGSDWFLGHWYSNFQL
jgi:hypothetical protein